MEYTELGTTGLDVSVISLGAGGSSKLGQNKGKTDGEAQQLVDAAFTHGINLIDTAEIYGTETIVGNAIEDKTREEIAISTKFSLYHDGELRSPTDMEESINNSLERLNTEYIDIYHLHAVAPRDYEYAAEELYPQMERLKEEGKIRFIGITETVSSDPEHDMLARAVDDGMWDVVMVGFNLLNHSARERVLEPAAKKGIGTIGMVAVRRALADPNELEEVITELIEKGNLDPTEINPSDPFGFLIHDDGAEDLIDACYRFCRHEPAIDTVLTGTSSQNHLLANIESVLKDSLPKEDMRLLDKRFGHIDSVIGN